jgi:energy-coupling factor transporter ATP-binding protein EcfA2
MYVRMGDFSEIFIGRKMTVTVGTEGSAVLDGVDLSLRQGEWLAVVGHSGSGKSTLAKVLAGVCPLKAGSAEWRVEAEAGAGQVRWVQQNPEAQLIGDTLWEDVTIGLAGAGERMKQAGMVGQESKTGSIRDSQIERVSGAGVVHASREAKARPVWDGRKERGSDDGAVQSDQAVRAGRTTWEERALEALSRVGLADLRDRKTEVLSGGQKQLLAIAGALAAGVDTLVLDEATSMIDPFSQKCVLEAVGDVHRCGAAIVWATHSLDELAFAERVVVLDKGKIVFDGTPRLFFYGEEEGLGAGTRPPCERFGFAPPYAVDVAWELLRRGWTWEWDRLPLRPEDFDEWPACTIAGGGGR